MAPKTGDITELLPKFSAGDPKAAEEVFQRGQKDLRRLARHYLRSERADHTLQPTALVNEAYLRISQALPGLELRNRAHFFAMAARTMRRVLVDHARHVKAKKRAGMKISLESALVYTREQSAQLLALDTALKRLAKQDARQAQ